MILGPVVLWCLITGQVRLSLYLFAVAMMSDLYDGYLARRSDSVTEFGKLMDPLADKVLVSLVLVGLALLGLPYVRMWMVAAIVGRELMILGCRAAVVKSGARFVTSKVAKWKTAAQMTWIASVLLYLTVLSRVAVEPGASTAVAVEVVLWLFGSVAVVLTVVSGAEYILAAKGVGRVPGTVAEPEERG